MKDECARAAVLDKGLTDGVAPAGDDVEDSGGIADLPKEFGEFERGQRRVFGGLGNNGTAGDEGCAEFEDEQGVMG